MADTARRRYTGRFDPVFPRLTPEQGVEWALKTVTRDMTAPNLDAAEGAHIPADWTAPDAPQCPRCKGVGWLSRNVQRDHPSFGQMLECPCGIVENRRRQKIWATAQIPPSFYTYSIDAYVKLTGKQGVAADLWEWRDQPDRWLVLTGEVGVGKTGLAVSLLAEALRMGEQGLYVVLPDFLSRIRATYGKTDELDELEVLESVISAPWLVLDDVGTATLSAWGREKLFTVVNHRLSYKRRTIFTTNLPIEDAGDGGETFPQHVGPRTWDRIRGQADVMVLSGESLR